MAPQSNTLCTNPFPHWYGKRTNGVTLARSAVVHSTLALPSFNTECSKSMKMASYPLVCAICTTAGEGHIRIPKACAGFSHTQIPGTRSFGTYNTNFICFRAQIQVVLEYFRHGDYVLARVDDGSMSMSLSLKLPPIQVLPRRLTKALQIPSI